MLEDGLSEMGGKRSNVPLDRAALYRAEWWLLNKKKQLPQSLKRQLLCLG
jgi:hypothetical protein